jgi:hypothetical protein
MHVHRVSGRASATRRQLATIAVLIVALVALIAIGVREGGGSGGESAGQEREGIAPRSAAGFLDSIGVNVHMTYYDTAYARVDEWAARLEELGVRHVRDGLVLDNPRYVDDYRRLASRGVRATVIVAEPVPESVELAAGPLRPVVEALEAPNEADATLGPDWEATLERLLPELHAVTEDGSLRGVPLIGPSFVGYDNRAKVDDLRRYWDVENVHPYPGGKEPAANLSREIVAVRVEGRGRPIQATETGYHTAVSATAGQPPVTEDVAAAYIPRMAAEYYAAGVQRTFFYELLDERPDPRRVDPEQHFGLLRNDLSPKPAFTSLRNLLRVVSRSPGAGERVPVRVAGADVERLLLERRDGSRVLLLWQRASLWDAGAREPHEAADVTVRVRFGAEARDVAVHRPARGEDALLRAARSTELQAAVGADVIAVTFR